MVSTGISIIMIKNIHRNVLDILAVPVERQVIHRKSPEKP
jgi:hypothetical protein